MVDATAIAYEVALSFAGEQRQYVRDVARFLQARGIGVFYDEFEEVRLWGTNLSEELHDVYENRADYVVIFISHEYVEKAWTIHERRSALARSVRERSGYVLPVRYDDTPLPGLPSDVRYEDAKAHTPAALGALICEKIGVSLFASKASNVPAPASTALIGEVIFDYSSHNGRYVIGRNPFAFETKWSKASDTCIHVYNDHPSIHGVAVANGKRSAGEVTKSDGLDFTSRARTPRKGEVVVLQNSSGFYAALEILAITDDTRGADRDELRFRYVIQTDGSCDFSQTRWNAAKE